MRNQKHFGSETQPHSTSTVPNRWGKSYRKVKLKSHIIIIIINFLGDRKPVHFRGEFCIEQNIWERLIALKMYKKAFLLFCTTKKDVFEKLLFPFHSGKGTVELSHKIYEKNT